MYEYVVYVRVDPATKKVLNPPAMSVFKTLNDAYRFIGYLMKKRKVRKHQIELVLKEVK